MEVAGLDPKRSRLSPEGMDCRIVNNSSSLILSLARQFNNPDHSDVTLRVGERRFYLHKLLLMKSEVFSIMLLGPQWSDSHQHEICLEEAEDCECVMEEFLRYFYTGQIKLTPVTVVPLMILANKYNVKDLEQSCEQYAAALVFSGTQMEQVFEWWTVAKQLNLRYLHRKCREYMVINMDLVVSSPSFLDLDLCDLKWFLSESDLVITSEFKLYNAVLDWLHCERRQDEFDANLHAIAPHFRFCMMKTDDLVELERNLSRKEKEVIRPYLFEAFKYHAIPFTGRSSADLSQYDQPRLYTCDKGASICTTLYLKQEDLQKAAEDVGRKVKLPVSLSQADTADCREWFLSFRKTGDDINLEVSSTINSESEAGTVEASVLIYKQLNNITFVKGVMQFRSYTRVLPNNASPSHVGHVFRVVVPADAVHPDSPYQICEGDAKRCMFKLIIRNLQESRQPVEYSTPVHSPNRTAPLNSPVTVLPPVVENITSSTVPQSSVTRRMSDS